MTSKRNFYRKQDEEEERNNPYRLNPARSDSRPKLPRHNRPVNKFSWMAAFLGCLLYLFIAMCSYVFFRHLFRLLFG